MCSSRGQRYHARRPVSKVVSSWICRERVIFTYWERDVAVFLYISHPTVDDDTQCAQCVSTRGHKSSPACRRQTLGLLNIHHMPFFVSICKMDRWRWSWAFGLDHLDGDSRAVNSGAWFRRKHLESIQESSVRMFEFDQGIANLDNQLE